MQTDIFTLCDAATIARGALNILGTFDTLRAESCPFTRDSFSVVARVRFAPQEAGLHTLAIRFIDLDGAIVDSSETEPFEMVSEEGLSSVYSYIWNLRGREFFEEGEFYFDLLVDDDALGRIPLYIKRRPSPGKRANR